MDKIKTVKIKNPDGSVSEETYTISVDAKDVDMANGKELQETIGTIDIDTDGNIAEQLENLNNNVDDLNIDIKKKAYFFDTVADMKNADLKVGDYVCTLGYYNINDGGAAEYKIVNTASQTEHQERVKNLYASLLIKNYIKPEMLGAYGDGIHNDLSSIQEAINLGNTELTEGKTYAVNDIIEITHEYSFNSNNSFIKYIGETSAEDYLVVINITGNRTVQRGNNIDIRIDCNEKINGINLISTIGNNLNLVIYNAPYGLKLASGTNCFENNISAQIDYYKGYGEIGATVLRPDNIFTDLTVMNYKTALYNIGTTSYNNFHAWLDRNAKTIYDISTMIEDASNGTGAYIGYFYCDTYRIGVKTSNYAYVHISEYFIIINKNEIGDTILLANPVYTYKRVNSKGQLLVEYLQSYETYAYLHIIDTSTSDNTNYIIKKANLGADVLNKMSIKELVFPCNIFDTTSVIFSKLPQTLQNAYTDSVIYIAPYGSNGTLGFVATYYSQARIYLYYGSDITNIAQ